MDDEVIYVQGYGASSADMKGFYVAVIRPTLEYGALVWNKGITNDQSMDIERIQKRALKIIQAEDDYDKVLQTAKLASLKERRDRMYIELIKSMINADHKLHNLLPKKVHEVRSRETGKITNCIRILIGEVNVFKTVQLAMLLMNTTKHYLDRFELQWTSK